MWITTGRYTTHRISPDIRTERPEMNDKELDPRDVRMKKRATSAGVEVEENKLSADTAIEKAPLPEQVVIPLHQNIGAPCQAVVKRGDKVLTGQVIGDSDQFVNAPVHATVSGEVTGTATVVNPPTSQLIPALVIASDGRDEWVKLDPPEDPDELTVEEILKRIRAAGLVGLGGAAFPSHVKLSPPQGKKIDTVILNGCECEPYITSDHRVMLEYGEQVLSGLSLIKKVLNPKRVYIAIEDNKENAIGHLEYLATTMGRRGKFKVVPLKSRYPMGAEKVLTKLIMGKEVPIGGLPMDIGAVVHNVSTAKAIHDAVIEGKPFVERVITVTGAVKSPKNLLARFGTPIGTLIDHCGGIQGEANEVILGGPMMGFDQFDLSYPTVKGTNAILVKEGREIKEQDCISCSRCLDACPMKLMPTMLAKYAKAAIYDECDNYYIADCFECGACAYACPADIPIVHYIKVAKKELANKKAAAK